MGRSGSESLDGGWDGRVVGCKRYDGATPTCTVVGAGHLPDVHHPDDGLISLLNRWETYIKSKTSVLI